MAASFSYSTICTVILSATLEIINTPIMAQDLIAEGQVLAAKNCARCHAIGNDGESTHSSAPPFRTLSERYPITDLAESLAEGIVTGHPDMPEFSFMPDEVEALLAYLQSVQPK
jgi:cytochrome c